VSCCDAKLVPASTAGALPMGRSVSGADTCPGWDATYCAATGQNELPEHAATLSDFKLDTFEVTLGRFRAFVAAYPGSKPAAGAGAHPKLGAASGWSASWPLPDTQPALIAATNCAGTTWTDSAGADENKPMNCVDWFTAFAFCAWDGGRLPTEAEWEYAAAGGSENRLLPWGGSTLPDCAHANSLNCGGAPMTVGSLAPGAARWGHHDLAGNVWEWTLDEFLDYASAPCVDCASTTFGLNRVWRGGNFKFAASWLRAAYRGADSPSRRVDVLGFRCARSP
jgi:formylglycine-generating enzyme required for sulfatase activity